MKKKSKIIIFLLFLIASCTQNINISEFNKQTPKYKSCLQDANHNIETSMNIKQDRIDMLQTNDSMIDLYNIENDMDEIKLSQKRAKMIDDCMKTK